MHLNLSNSIQVSATSQQVALLVGVDQERPPVLRTANRGRARSNHRHNGTSSKVAEVEEVEWAFLVVLVNLELLAAIVTSPLVATRRWADPHHRWPVRL